MDSAELSAIAACRAGDLSAFDTLYMQHVEPIYGYLSRRTRDRETAEDLTSQTFLRALEAIQQYDDTKGPLRAWLFTIARNLLTDHYRRSRDVQSIEAAEEIPSDETLAESVHVRLLAEDLKEALKGLTPLQREIVALRVWEGLSYKEIADVTGKKEGHCKVIFCRAVGLLREKLPLAALALLFLTRPQ